MTEDAIHKSILKYLRTVLPHGWIVMHVPNGGSRTAEAGAAMKALGVVPGWPDISIYGAADPEAPHATPSAYFMEVKTPGGYVRPVQRSLHDRLKDLGFPVAVVRSLDEAQAYAKEWGLPLRGSF